MSAGGARLDHQPVHAPVRLLEHGCGQRVGADDGQELRPRQRAKLDFHELSRVEVHGDVVALQRAVDMNCILRSLVVDVAVQHAGNFQRNARAHDDVSNACQHRAIDAREMSHLNLFQIIDAHRIRVSLASQIHLDEVGHDAQLVQLARDVFLQLRNRDIWRSFSLSAGDKVLLPDSLRHCREGKGIQSATHMTAGITILQAPRQNRVQRRSRDQSKLAETRDSLCQPPIRYACTHSTLDNDRVARRWIARCWFTHTKNYFIRPEDQSY